MRRRRVVGLGLVIAALVALYALWPRAEAEDPAPGPSPSASLRARQALRALASPIVGDPEVEEDEDEGEEVMALREVLLVVYLRNARNGFLLFSGEARFDPGLFWPTADELLFPDSATADELQELLERPGAQAERDWIALADAEGFSTADVDVENEPWAAVLGLEVERRAAVRVYTDSYDAAFEGQPMQPWTRPYPPLPAQRVLGLPEVDPVLDLAEDLIEIHPDHPAAEYARLYMLDALAMSSAEDAWPEAVDILRQTEDALVMTQTAQLLAALPGDKLLEVDDLDRLGGVYEDAWDLTESLHLAAFGLEQAMRHGDEQRTRGWLERFERSTGDACKGKEADPKCKMYRDNLDAAIAFMGDRDVSDAATWQQAFEIAAWTCARDHGVGLVARGWARWEGQWDWQPWVCDGADECPGVYTSCVEAQVRRGPMPEEDALKVRLTVVQ